MRILGIETSCDETAVAVLEVTPRQAQGEEITILSNVISSQVKLHAKYGGVVPNLAAREHVKNIEHVFKLALKKAKIKNFNKEIDLIAATRGPGLGPSLLVGFTFARTLAWKYDKPLIGVNHLEGHIYSNWLKPIRKFSIFNFAYSAHRLQSLWQRTTEAKSDLVKTGQFSKKLFPVLSLIVSGGHTELVLMTDYGTYKIIGETLDDAVGEAFDKVARLLGLGYPGGPAIAKQAEQWKSEILNHKSETNSRPKRARLAKSDLAAKFKIPVPRGRSSPSQTWRQSSKTLRIEFPRPMINSKNYNFSYAGLKTAVLYKVRDLKDIGIKLTENVVNEICYEFQNAALDVLVAKTIKAAQEYKVGSLFLSGGVSANKELRKRLESEAKKLKINYSQPEMEYTTDNAAMIAMAGYFNHLKNKKIKTAYDAVETDANLSF